MLIVRGMSQPALPVVMPEKFGAVAIALHWMVAVLVVFAAVSGLVTANVDEAAATQQSLSVHQSLGITVFVLIVIRATWRLTHPPPPLPDSTPPVQRIAAGVTHITMYLILLALPVAGYLSLAARGRAVTLYGLVEIPMWMPLNFQLASQALAVHGVGGYVLYGLFVLHVGAALYHRLVLNDGILERMWPQRRPGA